MMACGKQDSEEKSCVEHMHEWLSKLLPLTGRVGMMSQVGWLSIGDGVNEKVHQQQEILPKFRQKLSLLGQIQALDSDTM